MKAAVLIRKAFVNRSSQRLAMNAYRKTPTNERQRFMADLRKIVDHREEKEALEMKNAIAGLQNGSGIG